LMWLNLAAEHGDAKSVQDRDVLAAKMTPAEVTEAKERAREWRQTTSAPR
jgi:hypothetical protein